MELAGFIIAVVAAVFFLWLAFLNFGREKYPACLFFGGVAAFLILCSMPWFQGFVKTWLTGYVNSRLNDLGKQVNEVQKTTEQMQGQLDSHQKQIDQHQKELDFAQGKIWTNQMEVVESQKNITNQYRKLGLLQAELVTAQTNLLEQEKKIEDVEALVDGLYSKFEFENIVGSDTNRVFVRQFSDGTYQIFFAFKYPAINKSVSGTFRGDLGLQPLTVPMGVYKNIVMAYFASTSVPPTTRTFSFQYSKDTRETNTIKSVSFKDGKVLFDGIETGL
jgi:hypothetical protein